MSAHYMEYRSTSTPILIELEGIDGAGKTTIQRAVAAELKNRGFTCLMTSETGNPHVPICQELRRLALDPTVELNPLTMELLFAAQRVENYEWFRKLTRNNHHFVVSDRGFLSHLAYGHAAGEPSDQDINLLFHSLLDGNHINTVLKSYLIYLRIDPDEAAKRRTSRGDSLDRIEAKGPDHQKKVADKFERLLEQERNKFHHVFEVDANERPTEIMEEIKTVLDVIVELEGLRRS